MSNALIAGASGLVGAHCLAELLDSGRYESVTSIGRRPMQTMGPAHRHVEVDFDRLDENQDVFDAEDIFCCLGTTIKKAGSREAFRRVDHDYPLEIARRSSERGARQFMVVTAQGSDPRSAFFYNRVKGALERDLAGVSLYGTYIFRPTLLLGERDEQRRGEEIAERVFQLAKPLMRGPLRRLRPIHAREVARSMVAVAAEAPGGLKAYAAEDMRGDRSTG